MEKLQKLKEEGNNSLRNKNYQIAIKKYNEAIEITQIIDNNEEILSVIFF
jgi:hypothetical protein